MNGQSQPLVDRGKQAESRRWWWCGGSRRPVFFCILVLMAVFLFLCNTNIKDLKTDWSAKLLTHYNATKGWLQFRGQSRKEGFVNASGSGAGSSGPAGFTTDPTSFPQAEGSASTEASDATATRPAVNDSAVTRQTSSAVPVPYVSPGPYLVEYPYEYHFIINEPQKCEQQKPFLVLMVPVAPHNRAHRDVIRRTWGGESLVLGKAVMLFFVLGLHGGEGAEELQEQLLQESKEHRDLLQSDFVDCYKNLTIKTMVMMEWLDSYCSGAFYAMKIDSDMFLNVPNLINMLINAPDTNYMTGLVAKGGAVLRDPNSKWYLPWGVFPQPHYPSYALGLGYVFSLDLPKKLVEASRHVKPVYIEDVFVGLCMERLGIAPTDPPDGGYFHVFPVQYSRCAFSKLIATTTHENMNRLSVWTDFKNPGPYC